MRVRHSFVDLHPDGPDATIARPSDWNADHIIEGHTFDVTNYGADSTGSVDSTAAIQAAIDACYSVAGGGTVIIPQGFFLVSSTIHVNNSNIAIVGAGQDGFHDGGTGQQAATWLYWQGGALPMIQFATPIGSTSNVIGACKLSGIHLDGNSSASHGLVVNSVRNSEFSDLYVSDVITAGYKITCGVTGVDTAETADTQGCIFRNCIWRMIDTVSVHNAHGMHLTGSSNANTSFNRFDYCFGQTYNGHSIFLEAGDNNTFIQSRGVISGTGKQIYNAGSTVGGLSGSGANTFIGPSWSPGGCVCAGTDAGFVLPSTHNVFLSIDDGNGADFPVLGTGATCSATKTNGDAIGFKFLDLTSSAPNTQTGATYTVAATDSSIIANRAGTVTLTLPAAAIYPGRLLTVKTIQAQTIVSATSNVVPLIGGSAGTAILAATAGKWAQLQSDGTNWLIMASN